MPLTTQAKILRVLTDQSYTRVGGQRPVKVDVRVLVGDLAQPGRRDRRGPLPRGSLLPPQRRPGAHPAAARAARGHSRAGRPFPRAVRGRAADRRRPNVSDEAMAALQAHDWPGNVRQLRNIIERTLILAPGDRVECIEVDLLPAEVRRQRRAAVSVGQRVDGDHGLAAARGARKLRARISARSRSGAFRATSRAPPRSSAWSARRCTASSRRSGSATSATIEE